MIKKDIVQKVYENHGGLTFEQAFDAVEKILEIIKENLAKGEETKISGFGKFVVKIYRQKRGVGIFTGKEFILPDRKTVTFTPCIKLRRSLRVK